MKYLSDNKFAPATFKWGFIQKDYASVVSALQEWRRSINQVINVETASGNLEQALELLDPLSAPWDKEVIIETKSDWVAYFNNQRIGGDPFPPVSYASKLLHCRSIIFSDCPQLYVNRKLTTYGAVGFSVFTDVDTDWLNYERSVVSYNDGGRWKFTNIGTPYPFEEIKRYENKVIRLRMTDDLIEEYASHFGIRLFDESFYQGRFCLIEQLNNKNHSFKKSTYLDFRKNLGL